MRLNGFITGCVLLLWTLAALPVRASGVDQAEAARSLITSGGFVVTAGGTVIAQTHAEDLFIPASTIKIATALVALEVLGPAYRFKTEFYIRDSRHLCVKGYGDPFLISEAVAGIAADLKNQGVVSVDDIILDDSFFSLAGPADGNENSDNPYDAPNGALAVNFNALPLRKLENGSIVSGEPQTPLLPIMREIGANLVPGKYRLNVAAFTARRGLNNQLRYAGELITAQLQEQGVEVSGLLRRGEVASGDVLIHTHQSVKTVTEIVRSCLQHSNNFVANQLFLASAAKRSGSPATWDKARRTLIDTLRERFSLPTARITLIEGSGLSRKTRVSPQFMIDLLAAFKPYADLLPDNNSILLKSGTMEGVYGYAGYFLSTGSYDPFVILLNQKRNGRKKILAHLHALHQSTIEQRVSPPSAERQ